MIPILLGLFGLFYLGNSEVRRFENLAANDIRSSIQGEHAKVSVKTKLNGIVGGPLGDLSMVTIRASDFHTDGLPLFTDPERSKKGTIRDLRIELHEFDLAGLRIQALTSDIPNCHYDYALAVSKRKIRLSESGVGRGDVEIRQKDLEAFILRKFGEIKRVSVQISNGRVRVAGYGEFILIKGDFVVDANLVAKDGTKLFLDDAAITFNGALADANSRRALLDTLNPVIDLSKDLKLYDAIKVDRIVLKDGLLRASGQTRIPNRPDGVKGAWLSVWHPPSGPSLAEVFRRYRRAG